MDFLFQSTMLIDHNLSPPPWQLNWFFFSIFSILQTKVNATLNVPSDTIIGAIVPTSGLLGMIVLIWSQTAFIVVIIIASYLYYLSRRKEGVGGIKIQFQIVIIMQGTLQYFAHNCIDIEGNCMLLLLHTLLGISVQRLVLQTNFSQFFWLNK